MEKIEIKAMWEKVRNESWQKQEMFVDILIDELYAARSTLQFFSEDKYTCHQGFKHVEGTVGGMAMKTLSTLNQRITQMAKGQGE